MLLPRFFRLRPVFALLLLLMLGATSACGSKKGAKDTAQAIPEDDAEDVGEEDAADDVPEDVGTDAIGTDVAADEITHEVDDDADATDLEVEDDVEDIDDTITDQDATDEDTGEPDVGPKTDAKDAGDAGDVDAGDTSTTVTTGPTVCKVDKDCAALPKQCAGSWSCAIDKNAASGFCTPNNPIAALGTPCDDGDICTLNDVCQDGYCGGNQMQCDTSNPCVINKCANKSGKATCVGTNAASGSCSDGDQCTDGDFCQGGVCKAGTSHCNCTGDSDCTAFDTVGDLCAGVHTCQSGVCAIDQSTIKKCPTTQKQLDACKVNACDPGTGECALIAANDNAPCSDNDVCTFPDLCLAGTCKSAPLPCDDGNECTDNVCTPGPSFPDAGCNYPNNTAFCDDGVECTLISSCKGGKCAKGAWDGSNPACGCTTDFDCDALNQKSGKCGTYKCTDSDVGKVCQLDGATAVTCSSTKDTACQSNECDPGTGKCGMVWAKITDPCSDFNLCTSGDHCDGKGACTGGTKISCNDGNFCTDDTCLPAFGCNHSQNALPCPNPGDGNACTKNDSCVGGKCVGSAVDENGTPWCNCTDSAECAQFDTNKCVGKHTCVSGICLVASADVIANPCAGKPNDPCVTYACDGDTGQCLGKNADEGTGCNDGKFCTDNDGCKSGKCTGTAKICSDGNDCTVDAKCDESAGAKACDAKSTPAQDGAACSVTDLCTVNTSCKAGVCVGDAKSCDDNNPCTNDLCDAKFDCSHVPATTGVCDDGNPCTGEDVGASVGKDTCSKGVCLPGAAKDCSDGKLCTTDSCDPLAPLDPTLSKIGCVHLFNEVTCSSDKCKINESCSQGDCQGGTSIDCNDGNDCTIDPCFSKSSDSPILLAGCNHQNNNGVSCSLGTACLVDNVCVGSTCIGQPINLDDDNACTLDSCDPATGVAHNADPNGNCGPLAKCSPGADSKCVFSQKPLLFSEIYVGIPDSPLDDFVEIHNPTDALVDLTGYSVEANVAKPLQSQGWTPLVPMKDGTLIAAHGYLLLANQASVGCNKTADLADKDAFNLKQVKAVDATGKPAVDETGQPLIVNVGQIRIRDVANHLVHDLLCLEPTGCTGLAGDVTPVILPENSANSLERKAFGTSTAETMAYGKLESLKGNDYTDGATPMDNFVVRLTPDPQTAKEGVFEPACDKQPLGGYLVCDYAGGGKTNKDDVGCTAQCCAAGEYCVSGGGCTADTPGLMFSEIAAGSSADPSAQFIELYNADSKDLDASGFVIERRTASQYLSDPGLVAYQFPAGTKIPSHHYFTIGTQAIASVQGGVDALIVGSLNLDPAGGALRLYDPRAGVDLDILGWGPALACDNCGGGGNQPAGAIPDGGSIERKFANWTDAADPNSMDDGGTDALQGNGRDTQNNASDWRKRDTPLPQSLASGQFEPACGGACPPGLLCPYTGTDGGKCADAACQGLCTLSSSTNPPVSGGGFGCDIKLPTPKCASMLVIAQVGTQGLAYTAPGGGSAQFQGATNEYIMLYNRSDSDISLDKLAIQFHTSTTNWTAATATSSGSGKLLDGYFVKPHSYFLIAPSTYDKNLPTPDFVASLTWNLDPINGAVRIVRTDNNFPVDLVGWGATKSGFYDTTPAAACSDTSNNSVCTYIRVPAKGLKASDVSSIFSPWYYAGAGIDTNSNVADFVASPVRTPHNMCLQQTACPVGSQGVPQKP